MAEIGGDYQQPDGDEYARPLFSLMPNRLGLFVNDTECGTWLCQHQFHTAAHPGDFAVVTGLSRTRQQFGYGIYLVQQTAAAEAGE